MSPSKAGKAICVDGGQMVRPRSCRHSRLAGGSVGGVRSLSQLTSATEAADSMSYRSIGSPDEVEKGAERGDNPEAPVGCSGESHGTSSPHWRHGRGSACLARCSSGSGRYQCRQVDGRPPTQAIWRRNEARAERCRKGPEVALQPKILRCVRTTVHNRAHPRRPKRKSRGVCFQPKPKLKSEFRV